MKIQIEKYKLDKIGRKRKRKERKEVGNETEKEQRKGDKEK